ncbi:hypothetical protein GWK41_02280 [Persephonella atlantica]|uniref:Flagellar motor switch protein FliN-like C-terminal domain-containing protein n=1 Tax=Persephonella atlantica TaxID=2699429 RepID=A0ABS1GG49_9AQUI|nr:FliM/FliN family flagellar motor switch protein [Persephonella atlantica]MBK3331894.1 hypothetical protein [Persephonella atlantica]
MKEKILLNADYYSVFSEDAALYIKSDLFVMTVFSRGSDWAEEIFKKIFHSDTTNTEVVERLEINPEDTVFDVTADQQKFDYGIIVKLFSSVEESTTNRKGEEKDISLPVVIRVFSKTIPISEIENIGETTEILISQHSQFDVELLVNGRVIGKGVLRKEQNSFKLKISQLYV